MIKVRDLFRDTSSTEFVIVTIPTVIAYLSCCYLNNLLSTILQFGVRVQIQCILHDFLTNNAFRVYGIMFCRIPLRIYALMS